MADVTIDETDVTSDDSSDAGPKGLRDAKDRAEQKANTYHAKAMALAFNTVGLDVTEGIGKLILGAYNGEPEPSEIEAFALDNGWVKPGAPDPNAEAEVVRNTDSRLQNITRTARSEDRNELDERLEQAAKDGKWREVVRLQQGKFADVVQRKFG